MSCDHKPEHCLRDHAGQPSCIRRVSVFDCLTDEEVAELHAVAQSKHVAKGEMVFQEGESCDSLFVVSEGIIKISKLSDEGKEQIIRFMFPGDFFGQFSLLLQKKHYANAEALEPSVICIIHRRDFIQFMENKPKVTYRFLLAVSERLHQADDWMGAISLLEVERRLAKILGLFYEQLSPGDNVVKLPVAKKELAALIGTTPETLSRKLAWLEEQGIISLERRNMIKILDPQALLQATVS
ncbi:MAG TPA: Crp/Fnr family transcriptional regulator [Bacilli bacterium]